MSHQQTQQQADLTRTEPEKGLSDTERNALYTQGGEPGRAPVVMGGSSQGQSDQNEGGIGNLPGKVAGGHYLSEQKPGQRDLNQDDELSRQREQRS